jgi:hypothetical protein
VETKLKALEGGADEHAGPAGIILLTRPRCSIAISARRITAITSICG